MLTPPSGHTPGVGESQVDPFKLGTSFGLGAFQQPFVPQDLWQLPMNLEWDWADLSNLPGPVPFGADCPPS